MNSKLRKAQYKKNMARNKFRWFGKNIGMKIDVR